MRGRAALLALPSLLLLVAVAAGGHARRSDHSSDVPAISAAAPQDGHAELPTVPGAPLAPPALAPSASACAHALVEPHARVGSACGSSYVLADRPLLL